MRRRRRQRDQDLRSGEDALLHHLDRDPAGQDDHAVPGGEPRARQRPDQLVERVVPAHVLAGGDDALAGNEERGGMHRAGLPVQRLPVAERCDRRGDLGVAEHQAAGRDRRQRAQRLAEAVDPAEPAADRPRHEPPPPRQRLGPVAAQPHAELDAVRLLGDLEALDLVRPLDDALAQAEPHGEVAQVRRGRHHHRLGAAVVDHRHGGLLRQHPADPVRGPAPHAQSR